MRILAELTEDDVLSAFLRGEMRSERFSDALRSAMTALDIDDKRLFGPGAAADRRRLMGAFRGWGEDRELFTDWPDSVKWRRAALSRDEARTIRYILYDYWDELSGGTSLPEAAAQNIRAGRTVFGQSNEGFFRAADYLRAGGVFPPVLLLCDEKRNMVLVEGHLRMTAYALADFPFDEIEALVGLCGSAALAKWNGETSCN